MPDIPVRPLGLGELDYDAVLALARPLAAPQRDAFLQEVAELVRSTGVCGGELYRACRELQRRHWDPPLTTGREHVGKYAR
jgi:hypothetical protein